MQTKKVNEAENPKNKKTSLAEKEAKLNPAAREIWEGIKEGLEDVKQGRLLSVEEFLKELRNDNE